MIDQTIDSNEGGSTLIYYNTVYKMIELLSGWLSDTLKV